MVKSLAGTMRSASTAAVALALLAVAGCGGSTETNAPTTISEEATREAPAAETRPAGTTTVEPKPATTAASKPTTTTDGGPGPAETARAFAAAYERQDWPAFCDLFSRAALSQLRAGAASSGTEGETCPEIMLNVMGRGMVLEPIDVSGEATVDGDRATVGELTLVREDGVWKLEDGK